jgi:hypothetical protein
MGEPKSGYFARTWPIGAVLALLLLCGRCARSDRDAARERSAPAAPAQVTKSVARVEPVATPPRCVLSLEGSPVAPVFPTEAGLDEWFGAAAQNLGSDALATIGRANGYLLVDRGTVCSYVDRGFQKSRVRILAGPHEGKSGWVFTDWARK